MIEIKVCRGGAISNPPVCSEDDPSLNWGQDISDALLCTEDAAKERGRVEIDENYTNRLLTGIVGHSPSFIQPGSIVSVTDGTNSDKGLLKSISLNYVRTTESIVIQSVLNVEMII